MKISKLYKYFIVLFFIGAFTSCTKDFEEMNVNPNQPAVVSTGFLLTSVQKSFSDEIWDEWNNGRFGMLFSQYWAQNQYTNESRYLYRDSQNDNFWQAIYAGLNEGGGIQDLNQIIAINTDNNIGAASENQIAIARILRAYGFHILTDVYGPIPYSQALNSLEFLSPKYDSQESIYADLIAELSAAHAQIDESAPSFDGGDLMYGGDLGMWKKFASSLKLRVAMRMADVNESAASTAVSDAVAAGVFTSNAESAMLHYGGAAPDNNPLNEDRKTRPDFAVSNTLVDKLNSMGDPRVGSFADANSAGEYVGMPFGLDDEGAGAVAEADVCQPSGTAAVGGLVDFTANDVLRPSAPVMHLGYAEVEFLLAEAVERGFISGDASAHFTNGVAASMAYWGIADVPTDCDENGENCMSTLYVDYLTANPYDAGNWKVSIGTQKWLDMYMQGIQGWIEWRRLDFGILQLPIDGVLLGDGIPVRMEFPKKEQTLNGDNYTEASAMVGGDLLSSKVWWDVN